MAEPVPPGHQPPGAAPRSAAPAGAAEAAQLEQLLRARGALRTGHFLLSSGLHSEHYVQCQAVLAQPPEAERLGAALAARFGGAAVDLVVAPALGGVIVGYEVARALGCPALFAERYQGQLMLRRGQQVPAGARVLVVEDVVTTGGSAREVVELVRGAGGVPVGVAALLDRTAPDLPPIFGELRFEALLRLQAPAWRPEDCPRCRRGEPLESPGSRRAGAESGGAGGR
ncbi:MAG: orotate phosphoribosyltransferase [Planctomycetota bacterium]|nr:MAG: orotate phosphoribosyltransferase [Planctomycetota bacterium]